MTTIAAHHHRAAMLVYAMLMLRLGAGRHLFAFGGSKTTPISKNTTK